MARIFVIAGHGAGDPGSCGNGFTEAERVRALAKRVKDLGKDQVMLGDISRNYYKDNGIAALRIPEDYQIVELHMDSSYLKTPRGGHIVIKQGFKPDKYDIALADFIGGIFPGRASKIVARNDLHNPTMAARRGYAYRLVECGFISNKEDVDIFNNNLDEIAKGILASFDIGSENIPVPESKPIVSKPVIQKPAYSGEKLHFTYAVRAGGKILPEVTDLNDWAGKGDGVPITDIAIKVNIGSVKYRVHVRGGKWLPWVTGYDWNDNNNGYAGIGKSIDGIQVYYSTPKEYAQKYGYQKAQYRVSTVEGRQYYDWQYDTETHDHQDGYAGKLGKEIDKFQLF